VTERVCSNCSRPIGTDDAACPHCGVSILSSTVLSPTTVLRGRYEIEQLTHSGGMGYVYLAKDRNLFDRECVVKQVRERVQSDEHRKRLEEEALRMAKLSHPRIAMIFDHFVEDGFYFIVVERINGRTLSAIFKERQARIEETEVVRWATVMCDVMAYLHRERVVHRDISPDNIMINDEGDLKFIDFGTLRELRHVAAGGTAGMGKFGYTPPEQWQGHPEPRSDIFALGATMYYLLTGYLPLSDAYHVRQIPESADYSPSFPPLRTRNRRVSRSLEVTLQKALSLDVDRRFASALEMGEALSHVEHEITRRDPLGAARAQFLRKYRNHMIAAAAVLALALIGVGVYFIRLAAGP
jgi:serine/threonine protein kinase